MTTIFNEKTKVINESDDPAQVEIVGERQATDDLRAISLLEGILTVLKKIEHHLFLATDTELKDQDV